jgi:hypothetical protein
MEKGTSTILYIKETRGLMTLIICAWVMLTLLTHKRREYTCHVYDDSPSCAVTLLTVT